MRTRGLLPLAVWFTSADIAGFFCCIEPSLGTTLGLRSIAASHVETNPLHYRVGAGGGRRSLFQPHANPDPDGYTRSSGPNRYADCDVYPHDSADPEARFGVWSTRSPEHG